MEVKPGYKQTEVGVIPEDWGLEFIENLAHITTGGRNTQDRLDDGQYPFFVRSQTVERINSTPSMEKRFSPQATASAQARYSITSTADSMLINASTASQTSASG
jgi:hypothetical protein